jgi:tetratricopeptide (TPR) repeat protein
MKHLLFILFLAQHIVFANNVDSLKTRLDKVEGKPRINILIELMKAIGRDNVREVIQYGDEALALLKKHPDQKTETDVLFLKGWTYSIMNKSDSARITLDMMNKILSETEYKKGRMLESFLNARILRNENKYEDALTALQNAQSINDDLKETLYKIRILNEFGSVYRRLSRFNDALEMHNRASGNF